MFFPETDQPLDGGGEGPRPDTRSKGNVPHTSGMTRTIHPLLSRWVDLLVVGILIFAASSVVIFEISKYGEAQEGVYSDARQLALTAGGTFAGNLSARFIDLGFIASTFAGQKAPRPSRDLQRAVRIFLALHPAMVDLELQQGELGPVLWSTRVGGGSPLESAKRNFLSPLSGNPSLAIGSLYFSPSIGTRLLPLGTLVPGSALYVRTHVRMDALLSRPVPGGAWPFRVGIEAAGHPQAAYSSRTIRVPVASYPFVARVSWPRKTIFLRYEHAGKLRWTLEAGGLLLLSGMGVGIALFSRRQEKLLRTLGELSELDAAIFEGAGAIGLVIGEDGRILRMNRAAREFMEIPEGMSDEEPYAWERFLPEEEHPAVHDLFEQMKSRTIAREYENHWVRPSGERRFFRWTNTVVDEKDGRYLVTLGVDITERERLAALLREKNDRLVELLSYNTLRGKVLDAMAEADDEANLLGLFCRLSLEVSGVVLAWVGRPDPVTGEIVILASFGATDYLEGIPLSVREDLPSGRGATGQSWRTGGSTYNSSFDKNPVMGPWRERAARFGIQASATIPVRKYHAKYALFTVYLDHEESFSPELREILEAIGASLSLGMDRLDLKHREEESRALSEALLSNAAAGIDLVRYPERVVVAVNKAFLRIFGFSNREEIVGQSVRAIYFDEEGLTKVGDIASQALSEGVAFARDVSFRRRSDGKRVWSDVVAHCVGGSAPNMLVWTVVDVTERHELEVALVRLSKFRNLLAGVTRLLAERGAEEGLYQEICQKISDMGEVALAWVGVPGTGGSLRFLGAAGETSYMEGLSITVDGSGPEGRGPAGRVWQSGEPLFNVDLSLEFAGRPQALWAARHGFKNLGILPLFRRGQPWGFLTLYLREGLFDDSLQELLREMAIMISEGLDRLDEKRRERILSSAVAAVGEGVSISREDGSILFVNESFSAITGYSPEDVQGKNLRLLQGEGTDPETVESIRKAILEGGIFQGQILNYKKDGTPFWNLLTISPVRDDGGRLMEFVGIQRDVTEIVEVSRRLEHESLHDRLTGLPNRRALDKTFAMAFERSIRYRVNLAVVMIDLDDFKPVNDMLGHDAGDHLLMDIGERVGSVLRKTDFLARLGGDEFVLLVENYAGPEELVDVLHRVAETIGREILLPGEAPVHVGVSMGVAITSGRDGVESPDALLRLADHALYESKAHKSDREVPWVISGEGVTVRKSLAQRLLAAGQIEVHYQPILDLKRGTVAGLEALARMKGDDGVLLYPGSFLGRLTGQDLFELSRKVLQQVFLDMPRLSRRFPDLWISVNVDSRSVSEECVACLRSMLEGASVSPSRLFLEILEAQDFSETVGVLETLHHLKDLGVRLAMDDVGAAYSSLLRLKELPVDKVKLDQGFIRTIDKSPRDLHFVGAVQELVNRMGLVLVVEGVESEGVLDAMKAMGIDMLQGFAISRPLPVDQITVFLENFSPDIRSYPTTFFGLYALTLSIHGRLGRSVQQSPSFFDTQRLVEVDNCPVYEAFARMKVGQEDPIAILHKNYHHQLGDCVRSLADFGTVTEEMEGELLHSADNLLEAILAAYRIEQTKKRV